MGLSERKNKQKIAPDPRNLGWSQGKPQVIQDHLPYDGRDSSDHLVPKQIRTDSRTNTWPSSDGIRPRVLDRRITRETVNISRSSGSSTRPVLVSPEP